MMALPDGSTAIDAALVARFAQALDRLNPAAGRIGLAVSGGSDSMALLLLADTGIAGGFEVATVDHGLRPEAKEECALVAMACATRGIPCERLTVQVGHGNLQNQAREARYAALAGWALRRGLGSVATAHHADDQAETVMMRLNRGAGVTGLAGIREQLPLDEEDKVRLIRPLLGFRRDELLALVRDASQAFVTDPSNANADFERVRMRRALAGAHWLDAQMVARAASHLADADDALRWASEIAWAQNATIGKGEVRVTPTGPRAIRLRLIGCALDRFGASPDGGDLARMLDRLERGESGNLAGVLATTDGAQWCFRPEPPRRSG